MRVPRDIMHEHFERFLHKRKLVLDLIDNIPARALMTIPEGFANCIHWQAGHLVAVEASLLYRRAGLELPIDETLFDYFGKGTSPENYDNQTPDFDTVRSLMETVPDYTREHLDTLADAEYQGPVTVSTRDTLHSSAGALQFLPLHEMHHHGFMAAMRKFLR